jgi:hypothetical protein
MLALLMRVIFKYTVEMASDGSIRVPSFMKNHSGNIKVVTSTV